MTYKHTIEVSCSKLRIVGVFAIFGFTTFGSIYYGMDEITTWFTQTVKPSQSYFGMGDNVVCFKDYIYGPNVNQCDGQGGIFTAFVFINMILSILANIGNGLMIWIYINAKLQLVQLKCKDNSEKD